MQRRRIQSLISFLITAAVVVSCIRDEAPEGAELAVGDSLPDFSVTMSDGSSFSTSDLEGKVSLIMFFHTGCPDCRAELPVVQSIYEKYGQEIGICCISREEGAAEIEEYWQSAGLTLPWSAQEDRSIYSLFATYGVPRIYISDRNLTIYSVYDDDPLATRSQLAADIEACLAE